MVLTPEIIEQLKKEVDIEQYYIPSEVCTAQHFLFKEFVEKTKWKLLRKIIFYILLELAYGPLVDKDENGLLGYKIKLKAV